MPWSSWAKKSSTPITVYRMTELGEDLLHVNMIEIPEIAADFSNVNRVDVSEFTVNFCLVI